MASDRRWAEEGSVGKAGDKAVASHGMHSVCVCLLVDTLYLGTQQCSVVLEILVIHMISS